MLEKTNIEFTILKLSMMPFPCNSLILSKMEKSKKYICVTESLMLEYSSKIKKKCIITTSVKRISCTITNSMPEIV